MAERAAQGGPVPVRRREGEHGILVLPAVVRAYSLSLRRRLLLALHAARRLLPRLRGSTGPGSRSPTPPQLRWLWMRLSRVGRGDSRDARTVCSGARDAGAGHGPRTVRRAAAAGREDAGAVGPAVPRLLRQRETVRGRFECVWWVELPQRTVRGRR